MCYRFGVAVECKEFYDIRFRTREYVYYCADVPCLQTFFVYVVCQYYSVVFLVSHVHSQSSD